MMRHPTLAVAVGLIVAVAVADAGQALAGPPPTRSVTARPSIDIVKAPEIVAPTNRSQTYVYREATEYVVIAQPGRITDVVLQPGERLVGTGPIAAGDTARWVVGDTISGEGETRRVHVMLKPTELGLVTNLIINTDRRTYHLELRSAPKGWLSQVAWRYPVEPVAAVSPAVAKVASAADEAFTQLNFGYAIEGARTPWRPLRVFDDGRRTYVEFSPSIVMTELPPLFGVGADGRAVELLNYRVAGHRLIVDRILDRAELRLGQGRFERRVRLVREALR